MSSKVELFLLTTLLLISSSSVSARMLQVEKNNQRPQFPNWLVQTWPIGYCYARTSCKRNLPWEFTIHGLWPVDSNGNGLTNPISPPMKRNDISQVIQHHPQSAFSVDMNTYWPSLTMSNVDLWLNEWNNHGIYQNSLGPTAYFNNTIQLVKHMNLKQILAEEGIVPSNSRPYWRRRYITAITKRTQARHPLILCNPTPYGRFPVLRELVICVDTIANSFVPCPVPPHYRSLCPGGQIWFLQFLP